MDCRVGGINDVYYGFDRQGPYWLDIDAIWNAASKTDVPPGRQTYSANFNGRMTLPAHKLVAPLRDDNARVGVSHPSARNAATGSMRAARKAGRNTAANNVIVRIEMAAAQAHGS
jgi:hypothetical protein